MQSEQEMLSRVESMASGSQTWDLSKNDLEALKYVLESRADFERRMNCAESMPIHHPGPTIIGSGQMDMGVR